MQLITRTKKRKHNIKASEQGIKENIYMKRRRGEKVVL